MLCRGNRVPRLGNPTAQIESADEEQNFAADVGLVEGFRLLVIATHHADARILVFVQLFRGT